MVRNCHLAVGRKSDVLRFLLLEDRIHFHIQLTGGFRVVFSIISK